MFRLNSLEIRSQTFAQFLKLRGWRTCAWVIHSQNHLLCISYYIGHFIYDFILSHGISTPVIFNFRSIFDSYLFLTAVTLLLKDVKFSCASFDIWEDCRILSTYPDAYAKVQKWIFDIQFPGNWFELGIISNQFLSSII